MLRHQSQSSATRLKTQSHSPSNPKSGTSRPTNCRNTMSSTTNADNGQYQSMMSSLQHSLGAASIMSPPSTSSVSMSSHPIHRPQRSMAIQSSMSAGICAEKPSLPSHRNVRFNDQISGVIVPSLEDMSMKERQNVWYSPEEKAQRQENLKTEAKHMRRCMSHSASPESDQTSARGIEHLASGVLLRNLDNAKSAVIHAVLHEQHHQRMAYGSHNVDQVQLAMISSELSLDARKRAILFAASDQDFVLCEQQAEEQNRPMDVSRMNLCTLNMMVEPQTSSTAFSSELRYNF